MVGSKAGLIISTGTENTGVGWNAFHDGTANPSSGYLAGSYNTGIGGQVFKALDTGSYNIAIGHSAGKDYLTSGSGNIVIGYQADVSAVGVSDQLNIGGTLYGDLDNNRISVGNSSGTIANTFNLGSTDQFQINSSGEVASYSGLTTDGIGVPPILKVVTESGKTAGIGSTNLLTNVEEGLYRITYSGIITTGDPEEDCFIAVRIKYTDAELTGSQTNAPTNNIEGLNSTSKDTAGSRFSGSELIYVDGSSDIKYTTAYLNATNTLTYSLHITVERIQ